MGRTASCKMDRSLLADLRASAAKQAENAPNYAHGLERPKPGMSRMAAKLAGPRRDRSIVSTHTPGANVGRALDLANESPRIDALTLTVRTHPIILSLTLSLYVAECI